MTLRERIELWAVMYATVYPIDTLRAEIEIDANPRPYFAEIRTPPALLAIYHAEG
jgi:predicted secreted protein